MDRLVHRLRDDSGIGLIIVIGLVVLVTGMVTTASIVGVNSLRQATQRQQYEQAMTVAESGVDQVLARLQRAYDVNNSDYPVPGNGSAMCNAPAVTSPADFATEAAERTWAKQQLQALLSAHPECVQTVPQGQFLALKPATPVNSEGYYPGYGRIYAIGWSPSRTAPNPTARLVKTEYVFMPYRPSKAILTSGNLDISASTTVTVASGYDPTLAGVHSNGVITTVGNPTVFGQVSSALDSAASSTRFYANTGGAVATTSVADIPAVSATSLYFHAPTADASALATWYDLCPDGSVKPYSTNGPCQSNTTIPTSTVGWAYDSSTHTWTASKNIISGTFFAFEGNMTNGVGNIAVPNLTLIASSANATDCGSKRYGTINWDRYNATTPDFHNLFMYADADLVTGANFSAGSLGGAGVSPVSGMFVAGDQVQMETSSSGAVGSVLAADTCSTDTTVTLNQVKNPVVYFDPAAQAPFTSVVSTTLWLEYVG